MDEGDGNREPYRLSESRYEPVNQSPGQIGSRRTAPTSIAIFFLASPSPTFVHLKILSVSSCPNHSKTCTCGEMGNPVQMRSNTTENGNAWMQCKRAAI